MEAMRQVVMVGVVLALTGSVISAEQGAAATKALWDFVAEREAAKRQKLYDDMALAEHKARLEEHAARMAALAAQSDRHPLAGQGTNSTSSS